MNILRSLTICLIFITGISHAQFASMVGDFIGTPLRTQSYESISGSPYLDEDFNKGTVYTFSGDTYDDISMRYNAYEGLLEVINKETKILLEKDFAKGFSYEYVDNEGREVTVEFTSRLGIDGLDEETYYQILYNSENVSLVREISVKLVEGGTPNTYTGTSVTQKQFTRSVNTYVITNGRAEEIKLSKGGFRRAFPEHKNLIKTLIKENKTDFDDLVDLEEFMIEFNDAIS